MRSTIPTHAPKHPIDTATLQATLHDISSSPRNIPQTGDFSRVRTSRIQPNNDLQTPKEEPPLKNLEAAAQATAARLILAQLWESITPNPILIIQALAWSPYSCSLCCAAEALQTKLSLQVGQRFFQLHGRHVSGDCIKSGRPSYER